MTTQQKIDKAIAELRLKGVEPTYLNLNTEDYTNLVEETKKELNNKDVTSVESYKGITIHGRNRDPQTSKLIFNDKSIICSEKTHKAGKRTETLIDRIFELDTLKEII